MEYLLIDDILYPLLFFIFVIINLIIDYMDIKKHEGKTKDLVIMKSLFVIITIAYIVPFINK